MTDPSHEAAARPSGSPNGPPRVLVVYNPAAGGRRRKKVVIAVAEMRRLGCEVEEYATRSAGDATRTLRNEDRPSFDVVMAAGGDGTVNEVVNGIRPQEALAILPLGTVNVLARELGLPRSPREVAAAVAATDGSSADRSEGVGSVFPGLVLDTGRRFLMMVGVGLDAWVVGGVDLGLKRRIGRLAYAVSLLKELRRYGSTQYRCVVDGEEHRAYTLIVSRIRHYGGSFVLSPSASLHRRHLRVVLFTHPGFFGLLRSLGAFVVGRLELSRGVSAIWGSEVCVEGPEGEATQIDGDVGELLPVRLVVEERPVYIVGCEEDAREGQRGRLEAR